MKITEQFFREVFNESNITLNHFTELTAHGFATSLRHTLFNNRIINNIDTALDAVINARRATSMAKYERDENHKIIKSGATHLQKNNGEFCNKMDFLMDFEDETFEDNVDLAGNDTAKIMVNCYLEVFDDSGWLISTTDKEAYDREINSKN